MDRTRIGGGMVALVVALLGAVSCGGDDDSSDEARDRTEQSRTSDELPDEASDAPDSTDETDGDDGSGSSGDGSVGVWEGDTCSLLTAAEVEAQLGDRGPVTDGIPLADGSCRWEIGSLIDDGAQVVLVVYIDDSLDEDARALQDAQPVEGLGDEAWFDLANSHLLFRTGDVTTRLTVGIVSETTPLDVFVPLAGSVLGRL